jgi:hypothetical protein
MHGDLNHVALETAKTPGPDKNFPAFAQTKALQTPSWLLAPALS